MNVDTRRFKLMILATSGLLALLLPACSPAGKPGGEEQEGAENDCRPAFIEAGDSLPQVILTAADGESTSLNELIDGKVAIVDLWATWCAPCIAAMPHLQELYTRYGEQGFVVVGVMSDGNATSLGAKAYKDLPAKYPMLLDDDSEKVRCAWGPVIGYPLIVLVDRDGTVLETWFGTVGTGEIEKRLAQIFGEATEGATK